MKSYPILFMTGAESQSKELPTVYSPLFGQLVIQLVERELFQVLCNRLNLHNLQSADAMF